MKTRLRFGISIFLGLVFISIYGHIKFNCCEQKSAEDSEQEENATPQGSQHLINKNLMYLMVHEVKGSEPMLVSLVDQ